MAMRLAKWGNSLAIRTPASVVSELSLCGGEEVEVHVTPERCFEIYRDLRRAEALERLRSLRRRSTAHSPFLD